MILGAPGAGKTMSLLHIARQLLDEAEDSHAPMPVVVNLSRFQHAKPAEESRGLLGLIPRRKPAVPPGHPFENWLSTEMARVPGVSQPVAYRWITDGRVAVLLDGLDEVHDERRAAVAQILNDGFLREKPDAIVVICSRVHEYQPLRDRAETRLQLPGAVELQPLTAGQIDGYLQTAQAEHLMGLLATDPALRELAQSPLTLCMMTLAYSGGHAADIPTTGSVNQRRHHLLESYVTRMLQRMERRARSIPFDDNPERDIPETKFRYRPSTVQRCLGFLAARMSVRMLTSCSFSRLYGFLRQGLTPRQRLDTIVTHAALGLLFAGSFLLVALIAAPQTTLSFAVVTASIVTASVLLTIWRCLPEDQENFTVGGAIQVVIMLILVGILLFVGLAALPRAICSVLHLGASPVVVAAILFGSVVTLTAVVMSFTDDDIANWKLLASLSAAAFAVTIAASWLPVTTISSSLLLALLLGLAQGGYGFVRLCGQEGLIRGVRAAGSFASSLAGFGAMVHYFAIPLETGSLLTTLAMTLIIVNVFGTEPGLVSPAVIVLVTAGFGAAAAAIAGWSGALLAAFAVTAAGWGWLMFNDTRLTDARLPGGDRLTGLIDRWFLSPLVRGLLTLTGHIAWNSREFLHYCRQALLLKPGINDVEFIHRLLRDHFAIRQMVPLLESGDRAQRLAAIRDLGFQGISAFQRLDEYARDGDAEERTTAVLALGHISAPEVGPCLARAIGDPEPAVRRAVARSVRNCDKQTRQDLLATASRDPDASVRVAALEAIIGDVPDTVTSSGMDEAEREIAATIVAAAHDDLRAVVTPLAVSLGSSRILSGRPYDIWQLFPDEAAVEVEQLLLNSDGPRAYGAAIMLALRHWRPAANDAVPALIATLRRGKAAARQLVCRVLAAMTPAEAYAPLEKALGDSESDVRKEAALAIANFHDDRAVKPLTRLLSDDSVSVRHAAQDALRKLGTPKAQGFCESGSSIPPLDHLFGTQAASAHDPSSLERRVAASTALSNSPVPIRAIQ